MKRRKKHGRTNRSRKLYLEWLEVRRVLSGGWFGQLYDTYVDPVVDKYIAPVVNTVVDTAKDVARTVEKAATKVYNEVEEHVVEPVVRTVRKADKYVEKATDAVFDEFGNGINAGVKIAAGVYDGVENIVSGVGSLVVDVVSVSPIGIAVDPDSAVETAEKWGNTVATIVADPGKLVDVVVDQYKQEYDKNGVGGVFGMGVVEVGFFFVGTGEINAGLKATKAVKAVDAIADVSKVAKVSKVPNKLAKVADVVDDIAVDVAKTTRRSTTVMIDAVTTSRGSAKTVVLRTDRVLDKVLPEQPGKWNLEVVSLEVKTGEKGIPKVTIRERLDFSGNTHSRESTKNVDPEIQVDVIDTATKKLLKAGEGGEKALVKEQLPGFNGMGHGGRRTTTVAPAKVSKRK